MKSKITCILFILFSVLGFSQDKSYDLLQDKSKTKILYDRVFGISNATELRNSGITPNYFMQVYHEIQRADFLNRLPKLETIRAEADLGFVNNQMPLSILISDFEKINRRTTENGDLFLNSSQQFEFRATAQNVYDTHSINLISSIISKSITRKVNFILKDELIFNTTNRVVKSIEIKVNNDEKWKTIPRNIPFQIIFNDTGKQAVTCKIQFESGDTTTQSFDIEIEDNEFANKNTSQNLEINAVTSINSTIAYQGFGETAPFFGTGEYEIFPDTVNGILDKPIFLIDGFDPGDGRNIQALYSQLSYGTNQNLATTLRAQGFDIIVLNFPNYTRPNSTTVIDGGVDFIQRNAFVLVALINQINAQKAGTQKNVLIGPSMGGLISRYALRYMEMNNMNHDARLFISFDTPHKGANVPIGFQHFFNYLAFGPLGNVAVQPLVNGLIKSPAARQMLIDHMEGHLQTGSLFEFNTASNSLLPTGAPNFRTAFQNELNSMGFPLNTRNVSISNGAGNGTNNYSPNFEVMNYTLNFTTTQRAIINLRFTPAANLTNQVSRIRVQQLLFGFWISAFESLANSKSPTFTSGLDTAPGGRFNIASLGNGLGTDPILGQFFDNINADYFTFIPTWSSMSIENTNNLYTSVTSSSVSPFIASSIPTVNENHITLSATNVAFALNEILNPTLNTPNPELASIWIKNPIGNVIEINTNYVLENVSISLTDMLGKNIYQSNHQTITRSTSIPIDVSNGIYLLTIDNGKERATKKLVKN